MQTIQHRISLLQLYCLFELFYLMLCWNFYTKCKVIIEGYHMKNYHNLECLITKKITIYFNYTISWNPISTILIQLFKSSAYVFIFIYIYMNCFHSRIIIHIDFASNLPVSLAYFIKLFMDTFPIYFCERKFEIKWCVKMWSISYIISHKMWFGWFFMQAIKIHNKSM